jgi:hypothetical protein
MTGMNQARIPLMRFFAGELACGLVAAAVERLDAQRATCPQVSDLLGVARSTSGDQRTLHLFAYGRRGRLLVDGPTAVSDLVAADLIPSSRSLRLAPRGPVLGFARGSEHVVLLLDVAWLMERIA